MHHLTRPIAWGVCVAIFAYGPAAGESSDDYTDRMAAEHADDAPVSSGMAEAEPAAETTSSSVVYATIDERPVSGYLARCPVPSQGSLVM